jgi:hypothetical protein
VAYSFDAARPSSRTQLGSAIGNVVYKLTTGTRDVRASADGGVATHRNAAGPNLGLTIGQRWLVLGESSGQEREDAAQCDGERGVHACICVHVRGSGCGKTCVE